MTSHGVVSLPSCWPSARPEHADAHPSLTDGALADEHRIHGGTCLQCPTSFKNSWSTSFTPRTRVAAAPGQTTPGRSPRPRYAGHHGHSAVFPSWNFPHAAAIQNSSGESFSVSTGGTAALSRPPGHPPHRASRYRMTWGEVGHMRLGGLAVAGRGIRPTRLRVPVP